MLIEVKVPQLSESVAEATLLSWHKKQGEFVKRDENLIDIETDKVVLELPAPDSGVLAKDHQGRWQHGRQQRSHCHHRHRRQGGCRRQRRPQRGCVRTQGGGSSWPPAPAASVKAEAPTVMPAARKIAADNSLDTSQSAAAVAAAASPRKTC